MQGCCRNGEKRDERGGYEDLSGTRSATANFDR